MTESELLARKAALEAAKFSPTLEAEYDGKKIRYRSHGDIDNGLASINAALALLAGRPAPRVLRFALKNGHGGPGLW